MQPSITSLPPVTFKPTCELPVMKTWCSASSVGLLATSAASVMPPAVPPRPRLLIVTVRSSVTRRIGPLFERRMRAPASARMIALRAIIVTAVSLSSSTPSILMTGFVVASP